MEKAFNLTGEQVMAELTPEEIKGFNLSLPQMTPAAKRFVYLLAQERIEKAALLAACKITSDQIVEDDKTGIESGGKILYGFTLKELEQIQSAIEQAGEGV